MCILLSRFFRCWQAPESDTAQKSRGHRLRYLVRCANPYPQTCLGLALSEVHQYFDELCPTCGCTFVEPFEPPFKSEAIVPKEEGRRITTRVLKKAADVYTTALCNYLVAMFSEGNVTYKFSELVERWRVCNVEAACVFDPQHFHTNHVCDCEETNETPEDRNLGHAIRCRSSRRAITDDETLFQVYGEVAPHASVHFRRAALKRKYLDNHPPIQASSRLRGIPVLPFGQRIWDRDENAAKELQTRIADALQSFGSEEAWNGDHDGQDGSTTFGLPQRVRILDLVAALITEDCGLPRPRVQGIFLNFLDLLRPQDDFFTGPVVGETYGPAMLAVLKLGSFFDGRQRAGNALIDPTRFLNITLSLQQHRMIRFHDEHVFQEALKQTMEPVLQKDLDANKKLRCSLCKEKMTAMDRPVPEEKEFEHIGPYVALRVLCKDRHIFCAKCWMGYWKTQTADGQPDVRCHVCDEKLPLWRPKLPLSLGDSDIDLFEPTNTLKREWPLLDWPSQAPILRPPRDWGIWDPLLGVTSEPRAEPPPGPTTVRVSRVTLGGSPIASGNRRVRRFDDVNWVGRGTWLDTDGSLSTTHPDTSNDRPFAQQIVDAGIRSRRGAARRGGSSGRTGWTAAASARAEGALGTGSQAKKGGFPGGATRAQSRAAFLARKRGRMGKS